MSYPLLAQTRRDLPAKSISRYSYYVMDVSVPDGARHDRVAHHNLIPSSAKQIAPGPKQCSRVTCFTVNSADWQAGPLESWDSQA